MSVTNLWVGAVTPSGATVVAKVTGGTNATLKVSTASDLSSPVSSSSVAINGNNLVKLTITGLSAATQYYYGIDTDGTLDTVTTGSFRTAPSAGAQASFTFAFGSCNTTGDDSDAFTRAIARDPDLCIINGDLHYEDPGSSSAFYTGFDSNLATSMGDMTANVPTYYTWSDHDWSSDNNGAASSAMNATANAIFRERVPNDVVPSTTGIYQSFAYGRVRFIITDERSFKSDNDATDNSSKTMLGTTQKQWLKDEIDAATEPVIFWVGDTPWNGTASSPDDEWFAYDTERQELATFFSGSGKNIIRLSGDMHAVAADDGTNSPGGIPILHAAPWFNTFSNKGGPYTSGPYPTSGSSNLRQYGYVTITDSGATITVDFAGYDTSDVERASWSDTYDASREGLWSDYESATTQGVAQEGSASGTITWTGAATGARASEGSATGSVSSSGSSTGAAVHEGTASGSVTWVASATGVTAPEGSVTGSVTWSGTAAGEAPLLDGNGGPAAGAVSWVGSATGQNHPLGSASGTSLRAGSAAGAADLEGGATGTTARAGSATGARAPVGSAAGAVARAGAAEGQMPLGKVGSASGSTARSGSAAGKRVPKGTAAGTVSWVGGVPVDVYLFSPPTHEEPFRVNPSGPFRVLAYYRLTYASSLVKINGTWTAVRSPSAELLDGLEAGVDYFRGGFEYEISRAVAQELIAAGYSPTLI
jgi:alkaline phosphatase D